jgi:hypothetical protein
LVTTGRFSGYGQKSLGKTSFRQLRFTEVELIKCGLYANICLVGPAIQPGYLKKEKHRIASTIDELEAFAEIRPLTAQEIELKSQSNAEIEKLLREEDLKWYY